MIDWRLDFGCHQDQGSRPEQQDFFGISNPDMDEVMSDRGVVAVVADGMGGHEGGAHASYLAVQSFMKAYAAKRYTQTIPEALNEAVQLANRQVYKENCRLGEDSDMGTTLLATVVQGLNLYWVSVGDSRLYFVRNGRIEAVNKEHSYGAELDEKVRNGQLTIDQVQLESGRRHMLTSYLGLKIIPKINASVEAFDLDPGDRVLLCSDGLYNALSPQEIMAELDGDRPTQDKCEQLVQRALGKHRPRQDNITAVVLELAQDPIVYAMPEQPKLKKCKSWVFWTMIAVLLLLGIAAGYVGYGMLFGGDATAPEQSPTMEQPPPEQEKGSVPAGPEATPEQPAKAAPAQEEAVPHLQESSADTKPAREEVRGYQEFLQYRMFYSGPLDGLPGEETRKAIKEFQRMANMPVTGEFDKVTRDKLENEYKRFKEGDSSKKAKVQVNVKKVAAELPQKKAVVEKGLIEKTVQVDGSEATSSAKNLAEDDSSEPLAPALAETAVEQPADSNLGLVNSSSGLSLSPADSASGE